jgi:hypothetical protein
MSHVHDEFVGGHSTVGKETDFFQHRILVLLP